jgi:hypothetical protein
MGRLVASPLDALSFREIYGRMLRRPERGYSHAFIVAPVTTEMTQRERDRMIEIVRQSMYRCVDHGEVYYVSAEMTAFLQRVVNEQMQHRTIFHVDIGDLPSLTGFVYFDGQIQIPTIYSPTGMQNLRAILWDQYVYGPPQRGFEHTVKTGIYFGGSEGDAATEAAGKILYTICDTPNRKQRDLYGPWKPRHWIPAEFGLRIDPVEVFNNAADRDYWFRDETLTPEQLKQDAQDTATAMLTVFRTLTAWTRIIQTEIPVRHPTPANYDKIMHKEGRPPAQIKVVMLRRYAETPPHGLAEVDWAYRWEVKGHYRWQRVGPGRQFLQRVWVKEHIKGPPDKPLVRRDSVTALVR